MKSTTKLKVKLPDGTERIVEAREVCEHYATATCSRYGWRQRSPAWHDLASTNDVTDQFLLFEAGNCFPNSEIEIAKEIPVPATMPPEEEPELFGLYSGKPRRSEAVREIRRLLEIMATHLRDVRQKYSEVGADDTASREAQNDYLLALL